jgi:hypothetical protein
LAFVAKPGATGVHTEDPGWSAKVPTPQAAQVALEEAPVAVLAVPAGQPSHPVLVAFEKVPAPQAPHEDAPGEPETVPAGHARHRAPPADGWKDPGSQKEQGTDGEPA